MKPGEVHAVIGLGFGDEGKGHVVDWLASRLDRPSVVRFSGGPQAAHHVVLSDGTDHVFSHFGSGTLRGAPTYWSSYCSVNPIALSNELLGLELKGYAPELIVDSACPVITPYELRWNEEYERRTGHGSCGAGIYATICREKAGHHLWFEDLYHPRVLQMKMAELQKFYGYSEASGIPLTDFYWVCNQLPEYRGVSCHRGSSPYRRVMIYEGSQGLLLDQNFGFFPHVTPANTGTTNVFELAGTPTVTWFVTRAYQTRHGAGPMSLFEAQGVKENPHEMNYANGLQGKFRRALLDLDMLRYAISKDPSTGRNRSNLVVTCMDLLEPPYRLVDDGCLCTYSTRDEFLYQINSAWTSSSVGAAALYTSDGPTAEDITQVF